MAALAHATAVGPLVRGAALLERSYVVNVYGYLAAGAQRLLEQHPPAQDLPAFGVVDAAVLVGGAVDLACVLGTATPIGRYLWAAPSGAELDRHWLRSRSTRRRGRLRGSPLRVGPFRSPAFVDGGVGSGAAGAAHRWCAPRCRASTCRGPAGRSACRCPAFHPPAVRDRGRGMASRTAGFLSATRVDGGV
jgi:hypothetical protein